MNDNVAIVSCFLIVAVVICFNVTSCNKIEKLQIDKGYNYCVDLDGYRVYTVPERCRQK